jgi:hypothetical protein
MSTGNGRPLGRPPHKNSKAAPPQPGDEVRVYTLLSCCGWIVATSLLPRGRIRLGLERRTSAFAERGTGASDRARGMETGIYSAIRQWAHIGVIMVACSWHDALGADQLPREIVGNWCLEIERMLPETYAYRRCKDSSYHIIVRPDGFDAQETSCEANKIERKGAAWLASFRCSGAGLTWLEDDEIRVSKDGWTLETKIKNVRRVGDPIRYCLANKC